MAGTVECSSDGTHLAVHHPAGCHHVGTGVGLRDRDAPVHLERRVVVDRRLRVAGRAIEHATVPVRGVLVDAQVGHQHDSIADVGSQVSQRQLHDSTRVERLRADGILG